MCIPNNTLGVIFKFSTSIKLLHVDNTRYVLKSTVVSAKLCETVYERLVIKRLKVIVDYELFEFFLLCFNLFLYSAFCS